MVGGDVDGGGHGSWCGPTKEPNMFLVKNHSVKGTAAWLPGWSRCHWESQRKVMLWVGLWFCNHQRFSGVPVQGDLRSCHSVRVKSQQPSRASETHSASRGGLAENTGWVWRCHKHWHAERKARHSLHQQGGSGDPEPCPWFRHVFRVFCASLRIWKSTMSLWEFYVLLVHHLQLPDDSELSKCPMEDTGHVKRLPCATPEGQPDSFFPGDLLCLCQDRACVHMQTWQIWEEDKMSGEHQFS